jgi:hypothetical protein
MLFFKVPKLSPAEQFLNDREAMCNALKHREANLGIADLAAEVEEATSVDKLSRYFPKKTEYAKLVAIGKEIYSDKLLKKLMTAQTAHEVKLAAMDGVFDGRKVDVLQNL